MPQTQLDQPVEDRSSTCADLCDTVIITLPSTNQLGHIHSYPETHVTLSPQFGHTSLSERQARMRTEERPQDLEAMAEDH